MIPKTMRFYPYRMTFDIECMLIKDRLPPSTPRTFYTSKHQLVSVSLCSNVPGHTEPECFVVTSTSAECVERFVHRANAIASRAESILTNEYDPYLKRLKERVKTLEKKEKRFASAGLSNGCMYKRRAGLCGIEKEFIKWIKRVPVVGFNSQRYDINVIKQPLMSCLLHDIDFVVKKNDALTCVQTERLRFLDAINYISPGFSYAKYLTAYGVEECKGVFPYEWLDGLDKLAFPSLPPREAFYSSLTQKNVSEEDYALVSLAWSTHGMKTVRDLLIWYNNLDVVPFLKALETQCAVYQAKGIDMLKQAISLPGLSTQWMFSVVGDRANYREALVASRKRLPKEGPMSYAVIKRAAIAVQRVRLIDAHDADIYNLIRENTVGGPSLVFHRYHEKGITKIRPAVYGDSGRLCQEVVGVDANALYLYCAQGDMPVGIPRRFNADDDFCDRTPRKGKVAAGWLAWQETLIDHPIHTALNNGERRLGRHGLPVDGFCPQTRTAYEFNGCFWHGHCCDESSSRDLGDVPASDRNAKTALKLTYLRALGYTVVSVWECEWTGQVDARSDIKCFLKAFNDATYGCRRKKPTQQTLLQEVLDGSFFGYVECDIHVPSHLTQHFSEMSPIFINVALNRDHLSPHMLQHVQNTGEFSTPRRCLVGAMSATKILLLSELLRWYLKHGLVVTKIYQVIQYNAQPTFASFAQSVTEARRQGDSDLSKQLLANTAKLVGNSFYGKTITDKTKHKNIVYTDDEKKVSSVVAGKHFHSLEPLGDGLYEMCRYKRKVHFSHRLHRSKPPLRNRAHAFYIFLLRLSSQICMDVPVTVGFTILQRAKLRMLEYHYDLVDR